MFLLLKSNFLVVVLKRCIKYVWLLDNFCYSITYCIISQSVMFVMDVPGCLQKYFFCQIELNSGGGFVLKVYPIWTNGQILYKIAEDYGFMLTY